MIHIAEAVKKRRLPCLRKYNKALVKEKAHKKSQPQFLITESKKPLFAVCANFMPMRFSVKRLIIVSPRRKM